MNKQHKMIQPAFTMDETSRILYAKSEIKKRIDSFALTVQKLGILAEHDFFVSGGCVASFLQREEPKDIDIYFMSEKIASKVIELYKSDSYKNEVATYDEKYREVANFSEEDGSRLLITENAMTLKNGIQIIIKHYGHPDDIRKTFDFVHCLPYFLPFNDKLYISREQYDCCVNKILKNNIPSTMPAESRVEKFKNRGYKYGQQQISAATTI